MAAPLIVPSATAASGIRLSRYRRGLAPELGEHGVLTVSGTPSVSDTPDADRQVLCSGLVADGKLGTRYDGFWLYVCDGDEAGTVRQVLEGQYEGGFGSLLLDAQFTDPLASGTTIELCKTLPAVNHGTIPGLLDVINLALEELPVLDQITVVSDGTQRISLVNYPWPIKRLAEVYEPTTDADERLCPTSKTWKLVNDADTPYVQLSCAFTVNDVITLDIHRPANTWIRSSGVWGDSQTGLSSDADEALYDVATVVRQAMPHALRRMARLFPQTAPERKDLLGQAEDHEAKSVLTRFFGQFRGTGAQSAGAVRRR